MRADADFTVYVSARWPTLVRTLVLLGAPVPDAPRIATDALARCRRGWADASRHGDVDRVVFGELMEAWSRYLRGRPAEGFDEDAVLARYAGRPSGRALPASPTEQELREAAEEVPVLAPPTIEDLRDVERGRRRAALRRTVAVVAPLLLVAGGLAWWSTRSDDEPDAELGPARRERAENPIETVWYADGTLHLAHVTLAISGLRDATALGSGAVYGDAKGRVVRVADDGTRTVLGHKDPRVPVAATDENGWAAWIEPGRSGAEPRLVAYDARGELLGELPPFAGARDTRIVAVDGENVYFEDSDGAHAWRPGGGTVAPVTPGRLLDVRSRIRAFQLGQEKVQVVQSTFDISFDLPGWGASLSPDGNYVLTRLDRSGLGRVAIYDTRSGEALPTGLTGTEVAVAFSLGQRGLVTYVVAATADMSTSGPYLRAFTGGDLELRSCDLRAGTCEQVETFPDADVVPVLAR